MTKEIIIATAIEKNHKSMSQHRKECCNKVEELEAENSVAIKENYVAIEDEEERTEDCRDSIFYVATFQTYVATWSKDERQVVTNKFMLRQNSEAVENDKLCCNKVFMSRHKTLMLRQKLDNLSKTMSRHCQIMLRQNSKRKHENMSR